MNGKGTTGDTTKKMGLNSSSSEEKPKKSKPEIVPASRETVEKFRSTKQREPKQNKINVNLD